MTDEEYVGRAIKLLGIALRPFVEQHMEEAKGKDWLGPYIARRRPGDAPPSLDDGRFLLKVLKWEWETVFRKVLDEDARTFCHELIRWGNRWGHHEPLSTENAYRALDTAEGLLVLAGSRTEASEARTLKLELRALMAVEDRNRASGRVTVNAPSRIREHAALSDITERVAVVKATEEYDLLGRDVFLLNHGFRRARSYFLRYKSRYYDSKAIAGVAYGYQFPAHGPLRASEFSGGEATVARLFGRLGFEVVVWEEGHA